MRSIYDPVNDDALIQYSVSALPYKKRKPPYYSMNHGDQGWSDFQSITPSLLNSASETMHNSMITDKEGVKHFIFRSSAFFFDSTENLTPVIAYTKMDKGSSQWDAPKIIHKNQDNHFNALFYMIDNQGIHHITGIYKRNVLNSLPIHLFYMVSFDGITWEEPEIIYTHSDDSTYFRAIQEMDAKIDRNGIIHIAWHFLPFNEEGNYEIYTMSGNYFQGWSKVDSLTQGTHLGSHIPPRLANDPEGETHLFYILSDDSESMLSSKLAHYFIHSNLTQYHTPVSESNLNHNHQEEKLFCRNYPSPFSEGTVFQIISQETVEADLMIYNILGRKVKTLCRKLPVSRKEEIYWDGKDDQGNPLASGLYLYELTAENSRSKFHKKGKTLKLK